MKRFINALQELWASMKAPQHRHKCFLLVAPFEGELIICAESDSSAELYKVMDFNKAQQVVTREYYELITKEASC